LIDKKRLKKSIEMELLKKDGKMDRVDVNMLVREECKRFKYVEAYRETLMDTRPKERHRRYFSSTVLE